jgi:hypothetical protein
MTPLTLNISSTGKDFSDSPVKVKLHAHRRQRSAKFSNKNLLLRKIETD